MGGSTREAKPSTGGGDLRPHRGGAGPGADIHGTARGIAGMKPNWKTISFKLEDSPSPEERLEAALSAAVLAAIDDDMEWSDIIAALGSEIAACIGAATDSIRDAE